MPIQAPPRMTARQRAIYLASLDEFLRTGQDPSHINRLDGEFSKQLETMLRAAPANIRTEIYSGFRTNERQRELFNEAVQKYGSEKAARRHVAPPGKSFHNKGVAADLDFLSPDARKWVHANAAKYGLHFPMSWEPWHIEPIGNRNGQTGRAQTTQIQQALANAGFLTAADIDGISGPQTRSAIKAFQQKMGLTVDGIAGPQTLAVMEANAPGLLSRAATATGNVAKTIGQGALFATTGASAPREQVKALQNSLASRGFNPGPQDGIMGPRTQAALDASREAQTQAGRMGRPVQQNRASAVPSVFSLPSMSPQTAMRTPPAGGIPYSQPVPRSAPAASASLGGRYVPPSTPLRVELNAGERDRLMGRTPPVAPVASPQLRPSLTMAGLPPSNAGTWPAPTRTSVNPNMAFPAVAGRAAPMLNPDRTKDDDIGAVRQPTTVAARLPTARPAYTPPPAPQVPTAKPPAPPVPAAKPVLGQTLFETLASGAKDLAKSAIKPAVSFYMASGPVERAAKVGTARGAPGFWDAINASRLGPTDMARASFMAAQLYGPQALAAPIAMQRAQQVNQAARGGGGSAVNTSRSAGRGNTDAFGNAYGTSSYGTGRRGY